MSKIKAFIGKVRDALVKVEPTWLADKRKAIEAPVLAGLTTWLARTVLHHDLTITETWELGIAVDALFTYLIPNTPKTNALLKALHRDPNVQVRGATAFLDTEAK